MSTKRKFKHNFNGRKKDSLTKSANQNGDVLDEQSFLDFLSGEYEDGSMTELRDAQLNSMFDQRLSFDSLNSVSAPSTDMLGTAPLQLEPIKSAVEKCSCGFYTLIVPPNEKIRKSNSLRRIESHIFEAYEKLEVERDPCKTGVDVISDDESQSTSDAYVHPVHLMQTVRDVPRSSFRNKLQDETLSSRLVYDSKFIPRAQDQDRMSEKISTRSITEFQANYDANEIHGTRLALTEPSTLTKFEQLAGDICDYVVSLEPSNLSHSEILSSADIDTTISLPNLANSTLYKLRAKIGNSQKQFLYRAKRLFRQKSQIRSNDVLHQKLI
ncbi:hypothetical protein V1514DRAFT_331904 [Lipomyces japonicus]|uniref:uncharacterized protein n=1 Tax=Lipomyces japonicus TaxID=56871 RepID=UPI0034CF72B1